MKDYSIETAHEESYSDGRSIGVLVNYDILDNLKKIDSFIYLYRDEIYIFFETIIEMNDYLLYGDKKIKRAYMKEKEFDNYYDNGLDQPFNKIIKWIKE
jgi:hypothetical protein